MFDWDIQFYKQTELLATIRFQSGHFLFGETEFLDDTGVLETLYRDIEK